MTEPLLRAKVSETLARAAAARARSRIVAEHQAIVLGMSRERVEYSRALLDENDTAIAAFMDAVARYAIALRESGDPPERALRQLKEAFGDDRGILTEEIDARRALREEAVRRCIDAYFAA